MSEQRGRPGRDPEGDRALLAELGRALDRYDPAPAWLQDLARLSYGLRAVDLEVAELVADSQVDRPAAAVRAATVTDEPRLLSFETAGLLLDVQVSPGPVGTDLVGQLVPPAPAAVDIRRPGHTTVTVTADAGGRFTATGLQPGPVSLVCRWPGSGGLVSPWLLL